MILPNIKYLWSRFWMRYAGLNSFGRVATRLATWFVPPYYGRCALAHLNRQGYIAPSAVIYHDNIELGENVFIGDRVVIFKDKDGGRVSLGRNVHLYGDTYIQTGLGGSIEIGDNTHIQPRCQFSAYLSGIKIGYKVQIAPNCAFYPYDHGTSPEKPIMEQQLRTKGGIKIEDDVWLGFGVIVLDGVTIGKGAIIGAGAVVTRDIPNNTVAAGIPARIIGKRGEMKKISDIAGIVL